ncbi:MAG: hypothetical protein HY318_02370, partial [Armatimonadetes bacterium]|nr:hypothetical protein [Armatimonadota bacterium]
METLGDEIMSFSVSDFSDLVRLLEEQPGWRAELRRLVLTEEILTLPDLVRSLGEAQRRTEARVGELAEAQARTEARMEALAEALTTLTQRVDSVVEQIGELGRRLDQLTQRMEVLTEVQQKMAVDIGT